MGNSRAEASISFSGAMKLFIAVLLCAAALQLALTAAEVNIKRDPFHLRLPRAADDIPDTTLGKRQTCEPDSDEYNERLDALLCQKKFLRAFEAEIEGSNCKNILYSGVYDDKDNCDGPRDERENVRNCSETCSARVLYYVLCTTVGEQYAEFRRECGDPLDVAESCSFFNGDFCFLQYNSTSDLVDECSSRGEIECSKECRDAVETYVEDIGCCVAYWKDYRRDDDERISDLFSACRIEVPAACTSFSPPKEFLDCAHDRHDRQEAAEGLGPTSLLVTVSATIALIIAGVQ